MKKITYSTVREFKAPYWEFQRICEINEFQDLSQPNRDLPDNLQFFEMGLSQLENPHLDIKKPVSRTSTWDARGLNSDFRDRCVQYGKGKNRSNWFLYLKTQTSYQPPEHLDIEAVSQKTGCSLQDAERLVNAFKDLSLGVRECESILNEFSEKTYISDNQDESAISMLRSIMAEFPKHEVVSKYIDYLDTLAGLLEDVTVSSEEFRPYDDNICQSLNVGSWDPEYDPDQDDFEEVPAGDNNPYSVSKLYWGNEALPQEFITMILEADLKKLYEIKRGFKSSTNQYTGKRYEAKYRFLTYTQRQQAWEYIEMREQKIQDEAKVSMSQSCKDALSLIRQFGRCGESLAVIKKASIGGTYDMFGVKIPFSKITPTESRVLWAEYKAL